MKTLKKNSGEKIERNPLCKCSIRKKLKQKALAFGGGFLSEEIHGGGEEAALRSRKERDLKSQQRN